MASSAMPAGDSSSADHANKNDVSAAAPFQVPPFSDGYVVSKKWNHTGVKVVEFSYSWTIHNYSFCIQKIDTYFDSPTFSVGLSNEIEWCLRLYPRGNAADDSDHLSVYLVLTSSTSEILAKFEFSILNAKGEKCYRKDNEKVDKFDVSKAKAWGYPKFIKLDFLQNKENGLLPDDKLTISCEGTAALERINILGPSCELQVEVPEHRLSEDLGFLFENHEFSDVTLSVSGKDLLVHKAILAARSSVFAAMFKHEMVETKENRVVITDMDYDVLKEMLLYIYSGKAPSLENMAQELLVAANKYNLSGLKVMCETVLYSAMTVENVADLLVLADMHCAKQLKAQAIHFINTQPKNVMKTPAWENMTSNHPQIIVEVFEALVSQ